MSIVGKNNYMIGAANFGLFTLKANIQIRIHFILYVYVSHCFLHT